LSVGAKPTITPFKIIHKLKGNRSNQLKKCFPSLKYLGYKYHVKQFKNLWVRGYYCRIAGHVSLEKEGKDIFEYDIYGCLQHLKGQLKIGDFTR